MQVWPKAVGNRLKLTEARFDELRESTRPEDVPGGAEIETDVPRTQLRGQGGERVPVDEGQLREILLATAA
eukprot:3934339-Rhodomonas_salina.1